MALRTWTTSSLLLVGLLSGLLAPGGVASGGDEAGPSPEPGCVLIVPAPTEGALPGAVRLHPASGRTWVLLRGLDGATRFRPVGGGGEIGSGPFDLEVRSLVREEGWTYHLLRLLDRRTGRTWGARAAAEEPHRKVAELSAEDEEAGAEPTRWDPDASWFPTSESDTGERAFAPSPKGTGEPYVLCRATHGAEHVRGRRDTGAAWQIRLGSWTPIAEPSAPGPGDYAFLFAGPDEEVPVRVDRATGRAWIAPEAAWQAVAEAAGPGSGVGAAAGPYGVFEVRHGDASSLARWHPATGRLWTLRQGWTAIDGAALAPGSYLLQMLPGPSHPTFLRLDPRSGQVWVTKGGEAWRPLAEAALGAQGAPRFELRAAFHPLGARALQFDRNRGGTWLYVTEKLVYVAETSPPEGSYDVVLAVDGAGQTYVARLDRRAGRWDVLGEHLVWKQVQGLPTVPDAGAEPAFEQTLVTTASGALAVRLQRRTGETWLVPVALKPDVPEVAHRIADPNAPPAGEYELFGAVPDGSKGGTAADFYRFERRTGRVWTLRTTTAASATPPAWAEVR